MMKPVSERLNNTIRTEGGRLPGSALIILIVLVAVIMLLAPSMVQIKEPIADKNRSIQLHKEISLMVTELQRLVLEYQRQRLVSPLTAGSMFPQVNLPDTPARDLFFRPGAAYPVNTTGQSSSAMMRSGTIPSWITGITASFHVTGRDSAGLVSAGTIVLTVNTARDGGKIHVAEMNKLVKRSIKTSDIFSPNWEISPMRISVYIPAHQNISK